MKIIEIATIMMAYFEAKNAPNSISAMAPPQTPLGELTALPKLLPGFQGPMKGSGGDRI